MRSYSFRTIGFCLCLAVSLAVPATSHAKTKPYATADEVPLLKLLAPPPPKGSETEARELAEVLAMQKTRTEAQAERAKADVEETAVRFLAGMGITVDPARIPLTVALIDRLSETEEALIEPAKEGFNRLRPPYVNPEIKPVVRLSKSGAYPSGHATFGTIAGIVLANILPEKRDAIFARARDYALSRMIGGVHYRSDLEAGVVSGTAIMAVIMTKPEFQADLKAARAELRAALGMS
jgi:acid phosphatase (class A)